MKKEDQELVSALNETITLLCKNTFKDHKNLEIFGFKKLIIMLHVQLGFRVFKEAKDVETLELYLTDLRDQLTTLMQNTEKEFLEYKLKEKKK